MQCDGEPGRTPGRAESLHGSEEAWASAVVALMAMRVVVSVEAVGARVVAVKAGWGGDGGGERRAFMCVSDEFVKLEWRSRRAFDWEPSFPKKGETRARSAPILERFGPCGEKATARAGDFARVYG